MIILNPLLYIYLTFANSTRTSFYNKYFQLQLPHFGVVFTIGLMLIDVRNHWLVCKSSHYVQAEASIIMSSVLFQFCEKRICDTDPYPLPQNVMSLSVVLLESLIVLLCSMR